MPIPSQTAADCIIEIGFRESLPVTPLKLQKLLFFTHGWYLALTGEPLLSEKIEAWKFGPVVPSVYHEFKDFGCQPISTVSRGFNRAQMQTPDVLAAKPLMERVWSIYSKYSAGQLSALSHEVGGPWHQSIAHMKTGLIQHTVIDNRIIEQWFRNKLKQI